MDTSIFKNVCLTRDRLLEGVHVAAYGVEHGPGDDKAIGSHTSRDFSGQKLGARIVDIFGIDKEALDGALARIKAIVAIPEVGETYHGKVRSIVAFGAFVEIMPGKDALLHISEIDYKRFETMEETGLKEGDEIDVKLIGVDPKTNKLKLSRKALLPKPEGYVERERRPRPERGERGERRDRGERGERGERRERHEHKEE